MLSVIHATRPSTASTVILEGRSFHTCHYGQAEAKRKRAVYDEAVTCLRGDINLLEPQVVTPAIERRPPCARTTDRLEHGECQVVSCG
jgi:hypothetical protein